MSILDQLKGQDIIPALMSICCGQVGKTRFPFPTTNQHLIMGYFTLD
jgi:hypothetical protein